MNRSDLLGFALLPLGAVAWLIGGLAMLYDVLVPLDPPSRCTRCNRLISGVAPDVKVILAGMRVYCMDCYRLRRQRARSKRF